MKKTNARLLISVSMFACCAAILPAAAQEAAGQEAPKPQADASADQDRSLDEIIVTAERRLSTSQKTAASITVRSGDELVSQGRYTLKDMLQDVPGVVGGAADSALSSFGSGTDNPSAGLTIRGIPSNIGAGGNITSTAAAAALYTDEVFNGLGGGYDLDRVEVLRGPQGTLYGRSATSGVVSIHSRDPGLADIGVDATAEVGNYNLLHFAGALNLPVVTDTFAVRASGNYYRQDGFDTDNGGGYRENINGRVKALFKPSANFSALLGFAFEENKTASAGVSITAPTDPDEYVFTPVKVGPGKNSARQVWGVFKLDLGGVALTWIPAYRTYEQTATIYTRSGPVGFNQYIRTPEDKFHTEELRIGSTGDGPLQWQAGATYYWNKLNDENTIYDTDPVTQAEVRLSQHAITDKKTEAFGVFAQATYSFSPTTRFTGGLRYDHTKVMVDQDYTTQNLITNVLETYSLGGAEGTRTYNNWTYKARLEQDLSPTNLLYASVSTGFSPGDISVTTNLQFHPVPAELTDETLTTYEIGSKNRFLGGKLQINGAVYYNDYGGYQLANVNISPVGVFTPTFTTINLPVKSYGAELEILARPWKNGQFSLTGEYSVADFQDIPAQYQQYFLFTRVTGIPPFRVNASYNHTMDLTDSAKLILTGTVRYNSGYYASNTLVSYKAYEAWAHNGDTAVVDLNATLNFGDGKFSLSGYVRNLTNVRYKTTAQISLSPDPTDPTNPAKMTNASNMTLNPPRTIGLVGTVHF